MSEYIIPIMFICWLFTLGAGFCLTDDSLFEKYPWYVWSLFAFANILLWPFLLGMVWFKRGKS